jgi:Mrp family chromosome partitioning ATPase
MFRGRRKLPVLAEICAPAPDRTRVFSLRREDFARLGELQERLAERRVLLVTGSEGAGRTVAVAVAGAACAAGRRVVLVDCDLSKPRLAADLGLVEAPGVHEYLRWEATPREVLQAVALAGPASAGAASPLAFVAGGREAADPATLLGLQSFRHMAAKLRGAYDLVVLSGPALGAAGGTLSRVAKEADAVLAGLSPDQARGRGVRRAVNLLPPDPLGAVVVGEPEADAPDPRSGPETI